MAVLATVAAVAGAMVSEVGGAMARDPYAWLEQHLYRDKIKEMMRIARLLTAEELESLYEQEMRESGYFDERSAMDTPNDIHLDPDAKTIICPVCGAHEPVPLAMETPISELTEAIDRFVGQHKTCGKESL